MPHIVLKDNDFHRKLRVLPEMAEDIVLQLERDSNFLCGQGIMDYSMLLSVHSTKYVVDSAPLNDPTVRRSPTKRKINYPSCHPDGSDSFVAMSAEPDPTEISSDEDLEQVETVNRRTFNRNCRYSVLNLNEDPNTGTPLLNNKQLERYDSISFSAPDLDVLGFDDDTLDWVGSRTVDKRGYKACVVVGPDYYTLGVVDMLQTWTWGKRLERLWKTIVVRQDPLGISAAPPRLYAERFQRKMHAILMVPEAQLGCRDHGSEMNTYSTNGSSNMSVSAIV